MSAPVQPGPPARVLLGARVLELAWKRADSEEPEGLGDAERAMLGIGKKSPKRRREFIAGRLAARDAAGRLGAEGFDIVPRVGGLDSGRPLLVPERGISVSISHSSGWAVAVAARGGPVGVDLESTAEALGAALIEEAFAEGELAAWQAKLGPAGAHAAWAMKEAVLKIMGVGLRAPLLSVRVTPEGAVDAAGGFEGALRVETGDGIEGVSGAAQVMRGWLRLLEPGLVLAVAALER